MLKNVTWASLWFLSPSQPVNDDQAAAASMHIAYTCDYPPIPKDLPDMAILPLTMQVYKL